MSNKKSKKQREFEAWEELDRLLEEIFCDRRLAIKQEEIEQDLEAYREERARILKDPESTDPEELEQLSKKLISHLEFLKRSEHPKAQSSARMLEIILKQNGILDLHKPKSEEG
ncbi:hypothetical protein AYK26_00740 [Euryarchaeota archaeon SM23-78]|nr:MAG: hypothetical protein AYK26_00740 [Euryarchaeota archaeon SM23-78]